jgi:hypothetical protein
MEGQRNVHQILPKQASDLVFKVLGYLKWEVYSGGRIHDVAKNRESMEDSTQCNAGSNRLCLSLSLSLSLRGRPRSCIVKACTCVLIYFQDTKRLLTNRN